MCEKIYCYNDAPAKNCVPVFPLTVLMHAQCLRGAVSIEHGKFSPIPGTTCDVIGHGVTQ